MELILDYRRMYVCNVRFYLLTVDSSDDNSYFYNIINNFIIRIN